MVKYIQKLPHIKYYLRFEFGKFIKGDGRARLVAHKQELSVDSSIMGMTSVYRFGVRLQLSGINLNRNSQNVFEC